MTKYLIINSDDFGISENVSRGIIEAHLQGIVTSTSTMANMPAATWAIQAAQTQAPRLGLGLHFVLSYGKPVSAPEKIPSLVTENGAFVQNYSGLMAKLTEFSANDLKTELTAQFDRFVELAGRLPDHLDSHHNATYIHPAAWEVMLDLAQKHHLPIRRPLWLEGFDYAEMPTNADGQLIGRLKALYAQYGKARTTEFIADGTFFWDRRSRIEPLRQTLATIQDGYTELACHVGYGTGLEEDYHSQREDELVAFKDPSIVESAQRDFQLITFADLPQ